MARSTTSSLSHRLHLHSSAAAAADTDIAIIDIMNLVHSPHTDVDIDDDAHETFHEDSANHHHGDHHLIFSPPPRPPPPPPHPSASSNDVDPLLHHLSNYDLLYDSDPIHGSSSFFFSSNPNPSTDPNPTADVDSWLLTTCIPPPPPPPHRQDWNLSAAAAVPPTSWDLVVNQDDDSNRRSSVRAVINAAALRLSDITAALSPTATGAVIIGGVGAAAAIQVEAADHATSKLLMSKQSGGDDHERDHTAAEAAATMKNGSRNDTLEGEIMNEESLLKADSNGRRGGAAGAGLRRRGRPAAATTRNHSAAEGNHSAALKNHSVAVRNHTAAETTARKDGRQEAAKDMSEGRKAAAAAAEPFGTEPSDPLEKTLRHVDDLLQRTTTALSAGSFLLNGNRRLSGSRRNRKKPNPNSDTNPFLNPNLFLNPSRLSTNHTRISANPSSNPAKLIKPGITSHKRDIHIQSERQRRKGMTHLYATLHSLIMPPAGRKIKTDRCSVLTETMKYIQALLKQIEELKQKKLEIMASTCKLFPPQKRRKIVKNVGEDQDNDNCNKIGDLVLSGEEGNGNIDESIEVMNVEESLIDEWMCSTEEAEILNINHGEDFENEGIVTNNDRNGDDNNDKTHKRRHQNAILNLSSEGEVIENINYMSIWEHVNGEMMNNNISHVVQGGLMSFDYKESLAENSNSDNEDDGGDYPNIEVGVRLYGGEAFITLRTLRMRDGLWSGVIEILLNHHIDIININLSTSPDFDFHSIHAKVPSNIEIHCLELQKLLKAFVSDKPRENKLCLTEGKACSM